MKVGIRPFELADIKGLQKLNKLAKKEARGWIKYSANFFRELYDTDPNLVLVAETDGKLVGFILAWIAILKPAPMKRRRFLEIDGLFVKKEYRGLGIGTKLLKNFLSKWKRKGYKYADVQVKDKGLLAFYKRFGFNKLTYMPWRRL